MLKTSLKSLDQSEKIYSLLPTIRDFIDSLSSFEVKQVRINENICANFLEYDTATRDERVWEAHKVDFDLHYMYDGEEMIDLADPNHMKKEDYHEEDDYYLLHGVEEEIVILKAGELLLLTPNEPHRTGIRITKKKVRKIVFKIRVL